jgi:alkylhydroperoxidase/carboxymuconolactone decarboxylase family protein YurZ
MTLCSAKNLLAPLLVTVGIALSPAAMAQQSARPEPLIIQQQGSFAVGGTVVRTPGIFNNKAPTAEGQSLHGDHLYAFYQVPQDPKALPIVMLHGAYQSGRSWETTSDGREGFQNIFLRRHFAVYLVDQPRRGRSGNSTVTTTIEPTPYDQLFFDQFRIGTWPNYFDGVQFDRKPETLNQFFRSITPNTGPYDAGVISDAMSALFGRIGPGILFTHSQAGGPGWLTAIKNPNVKAVVAFEPGSGFVFPEGELAAAMPSAAGTLSPEAVSIDDFQKLTRIPIVIYYGDNIPTEPTERRGEDNWRVRLAMARLWVDAVNKHGGDARLVHLPEISIRGNTHFVFSDLNNVEIADLVSKFLAEKKLSGGISSFTPAQGQTPVASGATATQSPSRAQQLMGATAPKLAELTDDVLYRDIWERPQLSKRDRSLVTVTALIVLNRPDQLRSHLALARQNGVTEEELIETITHKAFYSGWPSAVSAVAVAKEAFQKK